MASGQRKIAKIKADIAQFCKRWEIDVHVLNLFNPISEEFQIPIVTGDINFDLLKPLDKSAIVWQIANKSLDHLFTSNVIKHPIWESSKFVAREHIQSSGFCSLKYKGMFLGIMFVNFRSNHNFRTREKSAIIKFAEEISESLFEYFVPVNDINESFYLFDADCLIVNFTDNESELLSKGIALSSDNSFELCVSDHSILVDHGAGLQLFGMENSDINWPYYDFLRNRGINYGFYTKLIWDNKLVGTILVGYEEKFSKSSQTTDDFKKTIKMFARNIGVEVLIEQMYSEAQENAALISIGAKLSSNEVDLDKLLENLLEYSLAISGGHMGAILFSEGNDLYIRKIWPERLKHLGTNLRFSLDRKTVTTRAFNQNTNQLISFVDEDPDYFDAGINSKSEIAIVLQDRDRPIGVLNIEHKLEGSSGGLNDAHLSQLSNVAKFVELAIQSAIQFEVIQDISKTILELQDPNVSLDRIWSVALRGLFRITGAQAGSILTIDNDTNIISDELSIGYPDNHNAKPHNILEGKSIVGLVASTGEPIITGNVYTDELVSSYYYPAIDSTLSELAVPILNVYGEGIHGVINLESPDANAFDNDDLEITKTISNHVAAAIENFNIREDLKSKNIKLTSLYDSANKIAGAGFDKKPVLREILVQAISVMNAHFGTLRIFDGENLNIVEIFPEEMIKFAKDRKSLKISDPGMTTKAFRTAEPQISPDVSLSTDFVDISNGQTRSAIAIPLCLNRKPIGVLNVEHRRRNGLSQDDLPYMQALATFAEQSYKNVQDYKFKKRLEQSIAREIKEPLAQINNSLSQMSTSEQKNIAEISIDSIEGIRRTVLSHTNFLDGILQGNLSEFSESSKHYERFSVANLLNTIRSILESFAIQKRVKVILDYSEAEKSEIFSDKDLLSRVLLNTVNNSIFIAGQDEEVKVKLIENPLENFLKIAISYPIKVSDQSMFLSKTNTSDLNLVKLYGGYQGKAGFKASETLIELLGGNLTTEVDEDGVLFLVIQLPII